MTGAQRRMMASSAQAVSAEPSQGRGGRPGCGRWPVTVRVRWPLAGEQVSSRAQDVRGQPKLAELAAGQQLGQRGQYRPVSPRQPRGFDLALEYGDLMAQDQDLGVLGTVGPGKQGEPAAHAQHRQISEQ
jgi:hypothetical protein